MLENVETKKPKAKKPINFETKKLYHAEMNSFGNKKPGNFETKKPFGIAGEAAG